MWQRNNGRSEDEILQNRFTAYLTTAVQRCRDSYIEKNRKRQQVEELTDSSGLTAEEGTEIDLFQELPLLMQLENAALFQALKALSEREREVFLARVLDGKSFEALGGEIGLGYKGVAAVYYRTVQKIKKIMKEVDE